MAERQFRVFAVGDAAILVQAGSTIAAAVSVRIRWVIDTLGVAGGWPLSNGVPAYTTVLFRVNPAVDSASALAKTLDLWLNEAWRGQMRAPLHTPASGRLVHIPICYGGEYGPDLVEVAARHNLQLEQVIEWHQHASYQVAMVGFRPGFPYLIGLPAALSTPRRIQPRVHVPAGSIGIGGQQTGIYPSDSPGGWQIIGRTSERLFDLQRPKMVLLEPGDRVQFQRIDADTFEGRIRAADGVSNGLRQTDMPSPSHASRTIKVEKSGLLTTVQDSGRPGFGHLGVTRGGAVDWFAAGVANLLVGNAVDAALLECTLVGPTLYFCDDTLIAVTGANLQPRINGLVVPLWQSVWVKAGSVLSLAGYENGCRAYVAMDGGVQVPLVLGSAATDLSEQFGGHHGRALQTGDQLALGRAHPQAHRLQRRLLPSALRPTVPTQVCVDFLPNAVGSPLGVAAATIADFVDATLTISAQSDRMGIRLTGWQSSTSPVANQAISIPVVPGTIQCPTGGSPVILLADAQTVGGYPMLGVVTTADLPKLAQVPPGASVRFALTTEEAARRRLRAQHDCLRWLAWHNP